MTPDKATALREADVIARLQAVPYHGRSTQAFLCHEAAGVIEALLAERERLRGALEAAAKRMDHCRRHIESGQVVDKDVHGALCRGRDAARQALEATDDQT